MDLVYDLVGLAHDIYQRSAPSRDTLQDIYVGMLDFASDIPELVASNPVAALIPIVLVIFLLVVGVLANAGSAGTNGLYREGEYIVFAGTLGSGKTSALVKLVYGQELKTSTSLKENSAVLQAKWQDGDGDVQALISEKNPASSEWPPLNTRLKNPIDIVDIPGHPRFRARSLAQVLPGATGVVFFIDSVNGMSGKGLRETAEYLHMFISLLDLLDNSQTRNKRALPRVLFLLSKCDSVTSSFEKEKSSSKTALIERAQANLQRELERRIRSQAFSATDATASSTNVIGSKLDPLEEINSSPSSSSSSSFSLSSFLSFFSSSSSPSVSSSANTIKLPYDEMEILNTDLSYQNDPWRWENVPFEVTWDIATVKQSSDHNNYGLKGFWEWVGV